MEVPRFTHSEVLASWTTILSLSSSRWEPKMLWYSSLVGARWVPVAMRYLAARRSILLERASRTLAVGVGRVPSFTMNTMSFPPSRNFPMGSDPIGSSSEALMTSSASPQTTSFG